MQVVQVSLALLGCVYCVRLGMNVGFLMLRTYLNAGAGPLVVCSVLLSSLSLCARCVVFEYGLISRF